MQSIGPHSLPSKMSLVFSLVVAIISLFIYLYFPEKFAQEELNSLRRRAQSISDMTSYTISSALFLRDTIAAGDAVTSACENIEIAYLVVLDDSGRVFIAHHMAEATRDSFQTRKADIESTSEPGILLTVTPLSREGRRIGQLYLAMSTAMVYERILTTRLTIFFVSVLVFAIGVFAVYFLTTILTMPLVRMVDTVRQITNGDLTQRAAISSMDEIGELASAFNEMVANLGSAQEQLREINRELEKRVEDRTAALARSEETLRQTSEQLRALSDHLQTIREEERAYIAREMHDQLGQTLTVMNIDLALIEKQLLKADNPGMIDNVIEKVRYISAMVESTIQSVRRLALELRPDILDRLGLVEALEWQVKEFQAKSNIRCELMVPPRPIQVNEARAVALFRMTQESLTNILRHAHASKVSVRLREQNNKIVLEIRDNGKGIKESDLHAIKSLGIIGMRERAAHFGGEVRIVGEPEQGTTITVELPVR